MTLYLRCRLTQYLQNRIQGKQLLAMSEQERNDLAISRVDAEQLAGLFSSSKECSRDESKNHA